ncbi:MAG: hypothetical protein KAT90_11385 [Gammaproteobacteria bacterium]|nr:hypothetical protein [Gammaproteobacteria bacterium]
MSDEKRTGEKAVPDNIDDYLNDLQQVILEKINKFGWSLKFVRRQANEKPIVVIEDQDGKKVGVMKEDGEIDFETGIEIRDE